MPRHSAGLLLYRLTGDGVEVLLGHPGGPYWKNRDTGAWTLVKGEFEPDTESALDAAYREFAEESGHLPPDRDTWLDLGTVRQKSGKRVHGLAAAGEFDPAELHSNSFELEWPPRSGQTRRFAELDRVAWFTPEEARRRINPAQVAFIERLIAELGGGSTVPGSEG